MAAIGPHAYPEVVIILIVLRISPHRFIEGGPPMLAIHAKNQNISIPDMMGFIPFLRSKFREFDRW